MPPDHNDDDDSTAVHDTRGVASLVARNAKRQTPYLIIVAGGEAVGKMVKVEGTCVVGRATDADICVTDDGVSRRHAEIRRGPDGAVQLVDLASRNGTFRNGERVQGATSLQDGDKIQVGGTLILKFSYQDAIDEELQRNLYESATRDGLTRLYNKKYFTDTLRKEFAYALRHAVPLSLVLFDVDFFKRVNDVHGHAAGDHVLQRIALVVADALRAEDVLARYGGEEFALVLREESGDDAFACAERVRVAVESCAIEFDETPIAVTISLGVATFTPGAFVTAERFLAAADEALYAAKRAGRNRTERAKARAGK